MLSRKNIQKAALWQQKGIEPIRFDYEKMLAATWERPTWIHFGAGNIFRGYLAVLQQTLLNKGTAATGIIAVETYDHEIIDKIYTPYDNLSLLVIMHKNGSLEKTVIGSVAESLVGDETRGADWERLQTIFTKPSLQMATFTITEKAYNLKDLHKSYLPEVEEDLKTGPEHPKSIMAKITALVYLRYKNGKLPLALVSMDNCAHNGEKLYSAVFEIAFKWATAGFVTKDFLPYLNNPQKISFPQTMIDKITPRPSESVQAQLAKLGFKGMDSICTGKNTFIAPFVNAEKTEYLVIEDKFPNGRLPLAEAGVYFTSKETVGLAEKMKVSACLNPLHTALAIFGCLLDYTMIADEMADRDLKRLVEKLGYQEGLPAAPHPGILNPAEFLKEVIEVRLPNPYIPDTPQRIATDTSQKLAVRFGETIKTYLQRDDLDPQTLTYIPLTIAAWCRYLMGVDDRGEPMPLSPDPMLNFLTSTLSGIRLAHNERYDHKLKPILANKTIFGIDLYEAGLGEKIENYFHEMIIAVSGVRKTLKKYVYLEE
ncbi:MAG: mannitol dehydrogenase family protein [Sporomusaceae bacterium]|jgi:fructuronate reductase|nr:mannitol dehydrogenase family protein [Sporomusaceae bacterium]